MAARAIRDGRVGVVAIALVAIAAALVVQPVGCNQTAHLALVKSLVDGTPRIDRYEAETCDDSYIDGHYYTAKAPGMAMLTVPWYGALRLAGLDTPNPALAKGYPAALLEMPRSAVWQVGLWGAVLAALALLLCVRWATDRLVPGYGTVTALTLGLATLVLPFASMFFVHVLSAALGFAAFCVLLRERDGPPRTRAVACAGLLAGLAVTVEFPVAIVAVALAGYVAVGQAPVGRLVAYATGGLVGIAPLVAFNAWAFGSPFDLSYSNAVIDPGTTGHDVIGANDDGLFGVGLPSVTNAGELLLSGKGLLVLTPIALAGVAGLGCLRRAHRREAVLAASVAAGFLVYNAAYYLPFGGWVPGPRFLVPALPFLALGIAAAYRARPLVTLALAATSTAWMVAATVAEPLIDGDDPSVWLTRIRAGDFTETVVTLAGGGAGWVAILPFIALVGIAGAVALGSLPAGWARRDQVVPALTTLAAWAVIGLSTPNLLGVDRITGAHTGLAASLLLTLGVLLSVRLVWLGERRALIGLPLAGLALPGVAGHTKWSLLLAAVVLAALLAASLAGRDRKATTA